MRKGVLVDTIVGIVPDPKVELSHGEKMEQGIGQGIDLEIGEEVGLVLGKAVNLGTKSVIEIRVMRVDMGIVTGVGLWEKIIDEVIEMGVTTVGMVEIAEDALTHIVEAEVAAETIYAREIAINLDLDPGQEPLRGLRNGIAPGP